jgi:Zn-dependent peptidase ImmA (M78 family)
MSPEEALLIAAEFFPKGLEEIIQRLKIEVYYSAMVGCDGWCLTAGERTVIRINSTSSETRQRFTLAHELAHLLLGIPPVIGESISEFPGSNKSEEREVDKLASQILLPETIVLSEISSLPVVHDTIKKLAKRARISAIAAALRISTLYEKLNIKDSSVILYRDNKVKWQWSLTLNISEELAEELLQDCIDIHPTPLRVHREKTKDSVVASFLHNPSNSTHLIFLQILPEQYTSIKSRDERLKELAVIIFSQDESFQPSLSGCFGSFKARASTLSLDEAVSEFYIKYKERLPEERFALIMSPVGKEYVKLKLSAWCK